MTEHECTHGIICWESDQSHPVWSVTLRVYVLPPGSVLPIYYLTHLITHSSHLIFQTAAHRQGYAGEKYSRPLQEQLRKCQPWSLRVHLVKKTPIWPPIARGHGVTRPTNWKIKSEKICFQHKLEWLKLHLHYLKWELVTCQPPPVLALGRNTIEICLWLVISWLASYNPFLENLMIIKIYLLIQMHQRFVTHNTKLPGTSGTMCSAQRNMELK